MTKNQTNPNPSSRSAPRRRTPKWIRQPGRILSESKWVAPVAAALGGWYLDLVYRTNKLVVEPADALERVKRDLPVVVGVWHGQHILLPALPIGLNASVMISRSIDGEITARLVKRYGNKAIRASGGRDQSQTLKKGGIKGFIEMLDALRAGENVVQTADVPKGTPRRVHQGIISLAQRSGRPIVPLAVASSRRKTFHKAWDRAALNLPFGTTAICVGTLVHVPEKADNEMLEAKRLELQEEMKRITHRAYEMTGVPEAVTFDSPSGEAGR